MYNGSKITKLAKHIKIGNLYKLTEQWMHGQYKLLAGDLILFLSCNIVENDTYRVSVLHDCKIYSWKLDNFVFINNLQSVELNDY